MSRELKFRVWDNDQLKFYFFDLFEIPLVVTFKAPVYQYIGEKDSNNKDIYEGDIYQYKYEYDSDYDGDMPIVKQMKGVTLIKDIWDNYWIKQVKSEGGFGEVIGNINQNKELIEFNSID